jgi:hypothetical protein
MKIFLIRLMIFSGLFLLACNNKKVPRGILPPEKMQRVMWDIIRADELATHTIYTIPDTQLEDYAVKIYKDVLAIHGVDKESFVKSFRFYLSRPDLTRVIFDTMINRANRERDMITRAIEDSLQRIQDSLLRVRDSLALIQDSLANLNQDTLTSSLDSLSDAGDSTSTITIKADSTLRKDSLLRISRDSIRRRLKRDN